MLWANKYLLNLFQLFGIAPEKRMKLEKDYFNERLPCQNELSNIVKELSSLREREFQYFEIGLTAAFQKEWEKNISRLMEFCIENISWWDTIDSICGELLAAYFLKSPEQIKRVTGKWNRSSNIWLRRCSIIFQNSYKKELDKNLLAKHILRVSHSKEFFVQKEIGWVLRQYSKTNPGGSYNS